MTVSIHPDALAELEAAARFYEERTPGRGGELIATVERIIAQLLEHPESGMPRDSPYRRALCGRFPFSVIYRRIGDQLRILAIAHQRRHPGYWKERT